MRPTAADAGRRVPASERRERGGGPPRLRIDFGILEWNSWCRVRKVLDYDPLSKNRQGGILLRRGGDRRKSTGSFYTPQSLTTMLSVARFTHRRKRTAERILNLRSSIRRWESAPFWYRPAYLARARAGAGSRRRMRRVGLDEGRTRRFRRQIAQRCLYGVDLNPQRSARAAVSVARNVLRQALTFLITPCVRRQPSRASPVDCTSATYRRFADPRSELRRPSSPRRCSSVDGSCASGSAVARGDE